MSADEYVILMPSGATGETAVIPERAQRVEESQSSPSR